MMKKVILVLSMVFALGALTGCTNYAEKYNKNTLIVKGDGSLVEIAVEDFSDSSVSEADLSVYITEQIDEYNEKQEKDVIKQDELLTEDMSNVKLVLKYKDIDSYNGFNLLECTLKDFSEVDNGDLKGTFTSADGESVKVSKMEGTKKAKVLIVSEKTNIVIDGDLLYYNKEVLVKDDAVATTGKGKAIIIYK